MREKHVRTIAMRSSSTRQPPTVRFAAHFGELASIRHNRVEADMPEVTSLSSDLLR